MERRGADPSCGSHHYESSRLAGHLRNDTALLWLQHALDPKQKALHETEGRWWVPDADISGRVISVARAEDIIDRLRTFPVEEAKRKLELMSHLRTHFSFDTVLTEPPNAVNVLMSGICKRAPLEPLTA